MVNAISLFLTTVVAAAGIAALPVGPTSAATSIVVAERATPVGPAVPIILRRSGSGKGKGKDEVTDEQLEQISAKQSEQIKQLKAQLEKQNAAKKAEKDEAARLKRIDIIKKAQAAAAKNQRAKGH